MQSILLTVPLIASMLFSYGLTPTAGASLEMAKIAESAMTTAEKNNKLATTSNVLITADDIKSCGAVLKEKTDEKARSFGFTADEAYIAIQSDYIYNAPDGIKIAYLPKDSIVQVLEYSGWSLVRSGGIEGYVKTTALTHSFEDFINSTRLIETVNTWDFVYSAATGDEKIALILPGEYEILEEGARDLVMLHDGTTGYVDRQIASMGYVKASLYSKDDVLRLAFIGYALPLEGKVPYVWGGKPYIKDGEVTIGSGLDCSGLIEYCAMKIKQDYGVDLDYNDYLSTGNISKALSNVFVPKFGDLGLKDGTGTYYEDTVGRRYASPELAAQGSQELGAEPVSLRHTDHVGIYLGTKGGKTWFIHENGSDDNISIDNGDCFKVGKGLFSTENEH